MNQMLKLGKKDMQDNGPIVIIIDSVLTIHHFISSKQLSAQHDHNMMLVSKVMHSKCRMKVRRCAVSSKMTSGFTDRLNRSQFC